MIARLSSRAPLRLAVAAALLGAAGLALAGSTACTGTVPDPSRVTVVGAPDLTQFTTSVSPYIEARCGSLDCHGQLGRPMRIYSGRGLRLPVDGGTTGTGLSGTSPTERLANYQAVVGVEPERLTVVVAEGGDKPQRLLIVTKPRNQVQHKGGAIVNAGADGDTCLTSWLAGDVDTTACTNATKL